MIAKVFALLIAPASAVDLTRMSPAFSLAESTTTAAANIAASMYPASMYPTSTVSFQSYDEQDGMCRRISDNRHDGSLAKAVGAADAEACKAACTKESKCVATDWDGECWQFMYDSTSGYHGVGEAGNAVKCYVKNGTITEVKAGQYCNKKVPFDKFSMGHTQEQCGAGCKAMSEASDGDGYFTWYHSGAQKGACLCCTNSENALTDRSYFHVLSIYHLSEVVSDTNEEVEKCSGENCFGYRGLQDHTINGKLCQAWASQTPHAHQRTPKNNASSGLESNNCRNPGMDAFAKDGNGQKTMWCYTTDPDTRWDYCEPIISNTITVVAENQYCANFYPAYPTRLGTNLSIKECADLTNANSECDGGLGFFIHDDLDGGLCNCCNTSDATTNTKAHGNWNTYHTTNDRKSWNL